MCIRYAIGKGILTEDDVDVHQPDTSTKTVVRNSSGHRVMDVSIVQCEQGLRFTLEKLLKFLLCTDCIHSMMEGYVFINICLHEQLAIPIRVGRGSNTFTSGVGGLGASMTFPY